MWNALTRDAYAVETCPCGTQRALDVGLVFVRFHRLSADAHVGCCSCCTSLPVNHRLSRLLPYFANPKRDDLFESSVNSRVLYVFLVVAVDNLLFDCFDALASWPLRRRTALDDAAGAF
jgi:hypothetical protein